MIHYRLRFEAHPDLDSDSFESLKEYSVGDVLETREGLPSDTARWIVSEVVSGDDEPDTLVCSLVENADDHDNDL